MFLGLEIQTTLFILMVQNVHVGSSSWLLAVHFVCSSVGFDVGLVLQDICIIVWWKCSFLFNLIYFKYALD